MTANDKLKCPECSHEMFEPYYCDYCANWTRGKPPTNLVDIGSKSVEAQGKLNLSIEQIDSFIQMLEQILNNERVPYLHRHAAHLLRAAREKRIDYDSVLNK